MVLKAKIYSLIKNFVASKYRKNNQLLRLYRDYKDYLNDERDTKIAKKIGNFKEKAYRDYQVNYYDVAEEKEIFDVVYNVKYEQFKKDCRMNFRVERESNRRKIAKLLKENAKLQAKIDANDGKLTSEAIKLIQDVIVNNLSKVEEYKKIIDEREIYWRDQVEVLANALKEEFVKQVEEGTLHNSKAEIDINEYKKSIEESIKQYSENITSKLNESYAKKQVRCDKKIERFLAKSDVLKEKLDKIVAICAELDGTNSYNETTKKVEKLNSEIASYKQKFDEAKTDSEKEKYQKILNSLEGDLSLIDTSTTAKEERIQDDEVLTVENLCMYFGGIKAVNHLNFTVKQKEIFGLIGPNGAGKTTVFNCITQFYKPTGGQIVFRNKNNEIVDLTKEKVHNVILHGIVRTFQNLEVIKDITVLDNLLIAAHRDFTSGLFKHMIHSTLFRVEEKVITQRAIKVLEFMGLLKYKDMYAWGLPYGILKKIEIARTLMCNPQLIILDEPAAGLNDSETVELSALIRRIRDEYNSTILLVEHDMGLVMDVCDRICAISFGNLLALGTPKEIQQDKGVQEAYLGVSED